MSPLSIFQSRYSTKLFDSTKKVSKEDIDVLIETARLAPSALGIPVVRLVHISDIEMRTELKKYSLNQSQITDASDMLVFTVKAQFDKKDIDDYITLMADTRNTSVANL
jgi:nitroreductase